MKTILSLLLGGAALFAVDGVAASDSSEPVELGCQDFTVFLENVSPGNRTIVKVSTKNGPTWQAKWSGEWVLAPGERQRWHLWTDWGNCESTVSCKVERENGNEVIDNSCTKGSTIRIP